MSERFVLLSGCSGGGKLTLLEELRARGHGVVEEPGRRIVRADLERGGDAPPWIDAVSALEELTGERLLPLLGAQHRYHRKIFLAPPWPEIYRGDADRRHGFEAAVAESERLERVYPSLGYEVIMLPRTSVKARLTLS